MPGCWGSRARLCASTHRPLPFPRLRRFLLLHFILSFLFGPPRTSPPTLPFLRASPPHLSPLIPPCRPSAVGLLGREGVRCLTRAFFPMDVAAPSSLLDSSPSTVSSGSLACLAHRHHCSPTPSSPRPHGRRAARGGGGGGEIHRWYEGITAPSHMPTIRLIDIHREPSMVALDRGTTLP